MHMRLVTVKRWNHPRYSFVAYYRQASRRQVRYFKKERDARAFAADKEVELLNEGVRHAELSDEERGAVYAVRAAGFSVKEVVDSFLRTRAVLERSTTLETAIEELLTVRSAEGKSKAHIADTHHRLGAFERAIGGERLIASITTSELDGWLSGLAVAPQTRLNYRRVAHALFAFGVARGYCTSNPVTAAHKPKVLPTPIGILSVAEARALLEACDESILASVAIALFGGLRREEIARLHWSEIDLGRGFVHVAAAKSKTAQRRLVTISENLAAWLAPLARQRGPVMPRAMTYRRRFRDAITAAALLPWKQNAMRHSFGSYHLAKWQSAEKTVHELGHSGSALLYHHYRELRTPQQASDYWQIFPRAY